MPQAAEVAGITEHDTQQVEQSDTARDAGGKSNDQKEVRFSKCCERNLWYRLLNMLTLLERQMT